MSYNFTQYVKILQLGIWNVFYLQPLTLCRTLKRNAILKRQYMRLLHQVWFSCRCSNRRAIRRQWCRGCVHLSRPRTKPKRHGRYVFSENIRCVFDHCFPYIHCCKKRNSKAADMQNVFALSEMSCFVPVESKKYSACWNTLWNQHACSRKHSEDKFRKVRSCDNKHPFVFFIITFSTYK